MPTYRFSIRKYIREDGIANNFVDLDLTDSEFATITEYREDKAKISGFVSSRLRRGVQVLDFPTEVVSEKPADFHANTTFKKRKSRIARFCATPFDYVLKILI